MAEPIVGTPDRRGLAWSGAGLTTLRPLADERQEFWMRRQSAQRPVLRVPEQCQPLQQTFPQQEHRQGGVPQAARAQKSEEGRVACLTQGSKYPGLGEADTARAIHGK